jgi:outer membrane receptor for ferrienterochelin and colicins
MITIKKNRGYLLLILLTIGTVSFGQDAVIEPASISDLSLEELMNIPVVTASKTSQGVLDAPAVMTVISEREIISYGAMTLQDLLDRVVGANTYGALAVPNSIYSIRGATTVIDNLHILVLIDGRPTRESFRNGQYTAFYQAFPVESIKRVEVIRGPGSVLYGSGAYMGVVNIITKKGGESKSSFKARYGTGNSHQVSGLINKQVKDLKLSLGLNYLDDGGWDYSAIDEKGVAGSFEYRKRAMGANLTANYKDFRFAAFAGDHEQNAISNKPEWTYDPRNGADSLGVWVVSTPRIFTNLGYDKGISDNWDLSFDVTFNRFNYRNEYKDVGFEKFQDGWSNGTLLEFTNYIRPNKNFNIVFGGSANIQSGEFELFYFNEDGSKYSILENTTLPSPAFTAIPKFNTTWYALYTQMDYSISKAIKLVGGVQINKVEGIDLDYVPRLGAIVKFSDKIGAKLLYSNAFRAPVGLQTSLNNAGTLYGNPDLAPEKNTTYEAQFMYSSSKMETSITFFNIKQNDIIARSLPSDSLYVNASGNKTATPMFINDGTLTINGVEIEGKYTISDKLYSNLGISYYDNEDANGNKNYQGTPQFTAKVGLSFNNRNGIAIGLFNTFAGKTESIDAIKNGVNTTQHVNPETKAYSYMTANISLELNKLFNFKGNNTFIFNIYGTNILDQDIYYAEYARRQINSLPGKGGAAIYSSLQIRF